VSCDFPLLSCIVIEQSRQCDPSRFTCLPKQLEKSPRRFFVESGVDFANNYSQPIVSNKVVKYLIGTRLSSFASVQAKSNKDIIRMLFKYSRPLLSSCRRFFSSHSTPSSEHRNAITVLTAEHLCLIICNSWL
jgi:hypothetical protein